MSLFPHKKTDDVHVRRIGNTCPRFGAIKFIKSIIHANIISRLALIVKPSLLLIPLSFKK
jgi:hypothetical protein